MEKEKVEKLDYSKDLEANQLRETKAGPLVGGIMFMDAKVMDEVMAKKDFNFICINLPRDPDESNFICTYEK